MNRVESEAIEKALTFGKVVDAQGVPTSVTALFQIEVHVSGSADWTDEQGLRQHLASVLRRYVAYLES